MIHVEKFSGIAPKIANGALPDNAGQTAKNVRLTGGSLRSVNTPSRQYSGTAVASTAKTIFMLGAPSSEIPMTFTGDVDVAPGVVTDSEYRVYFTDGATPKKTSLSLATTAGAPYTGGWYNLGVPGPSAAPSMAVIAGTIPISTAVVYVYTFVTQFGTSTLLEESAPSATLSYTTTAAQGIRLTIPDPTGYVTTPGASNSYNYTKKRVYRSTGSDFLMIGEVNIGTTTLDDTTLTIGASYGSVLPTTGWLPPPSDLSGICALPSGVLVGFRGNEVWFSEPSFPHAWPIKYSQQFDYPVVGLKVFENTVVIATQAFPYAGSGVHPDSFTFQKVSMLEPCISKRSMAADQFGVMYASQNGIIGIGIDQNGAVTSDFISRNDFIQFQPDTFVAAIFERRYYGFFTSATYGNGAFVYARDDKIAPISTSSVYASAVTISKNGASMLYVSGDDNGIYKFDPSDTVPMTYTWKSKLFSESPRSYSCFRITSPESTPDEVAANAAIAAINAATVTANAALFAADLKNYLNGMELNAYGLNDSSMSPMLPTISSTVGVTVYAARAQLLSGNFSTNTIYRLPVPPGGKAVGWEFQITGQKEVFAVDIAMSPSELRGEIA